MWIPRQSTLLFLIGSCLSVATCALTQAQNPLLENDEPTAKLPEVSVPEVAEPELPENPGRLIPGRAMPPLEQEAPSAPAAPSQPFQDSDGPDAPSPPEPEEQSSSQSLFAELIAPPAIEPGKQEPSDLPQDIDVKRVFERDFYGIVPSDAPNRLTIQCRHYRQLPNGKKSAYMVQQLVDSTDKSLTPEQCLGIASGALEARIREAKGSLMNLAGSENNENREALLKKLKQLYTLRFNLDTAYQDLKVTEIETRAAKLRAEVAAREKASSEWVDAMVTLAKMKSNGIETGIADVSPFPALSNSRDLQSSDSFYIPSPRNQVGAGYPTQPSLNDPRMEREWRQPDSNDRQPFPLN